MSIPGHRADEVTQRFQRARTESGQALVHAILGTADALFSVDDSDAFCSAGLQLALELLHLDQCRVSIVDPGGTSATQRSSAASGPEPSDVTTGLLAEAFRNRDLMVLRGDDLRRAADPVRDAEFLSPHVQAVAILPVGAGIRSAKGAVIGATNKPEGFADDELVSMRMFGWHLGSALELLHARYDLRHWNAIVDSSHVAIVGKTSDGHVTHWNPAAERLYGYTAQEAIGQHISFIIPEDRRAEQEEYLKAIQAGHKVVEFETVRLAKDGSRVDVSLTLSPIRNSRGVVVGASAFNRDVRDERAQRELFRQSVESAPTAILAVNAIDGTISLANHEAETLFGYTREELKGAPVERLLPDELRGPHKEHRSAFNERPQKRTMGMGRDLWAVGKDGNFIRVEVGLNPIKVGNERLVLASIIDVSERTRQEQERARLLKDAQEAVAARDTFLSTASHELKTPLTALKLITQGLLRGASRGDRLELDGVVNKLGRMSRQVDRLSKLIDQLLDVSRITARRLELELERTELGGLLRDVVARYLHSDGAPELNVEATPPIWGRWDAGRLDQVFTNLVGNAVKYGEGRPVDIEIEDRGDSVCVAIRDQGPGIKPADQARIFERFERLVSHRHYGGFGLGLWIVRQLVHAHHGEIEVVSEQGRGSTFLVRLPKDAPHEEGEGR